MQNRVINDHVLLRINYLSIHKVGKISSTFTSCAVFVPHQVAIIPEIFGPYSFIY